MGRQRLAGFVGEFGVVGVADGDGAEVARLFVWGMISHQVRKAKAQGAADSDGGPDIACRTYAHGSAIDVFGAGRKWSEIAAWEHTFAAKPTDRRPWALIACRTTRQIVSVELIGTHGDAIESFAVRRDVPIERMSFGVGQVGVGQRRFAVYRLL